MATNPTSHRNRTGHAKNVADGTISAPPAERPYVVVAGVKVSAGAPTSAEALCADIAWQYKKINGLDWELFFVAVNYDTDGDVNAMHRWPRKKKENDRAAGP